MISFLEWHSQICLLVCQTSQLLAAVCGSEDVDNPGRSGEVSDFHVDRHLIHWDSTVDEECSQFPRPPLPQTARQVDIANVAAPIPWAVDCAWRW